MNFEVKTFQWICDECGFKQQEKGEIALTPEFWTRRERYCDEADCPGHDEDLCPSCTEAWKK